MRVIQWNTHHGGIGSDGILDVRRFATALAALEPDVVCLNEVEQWVGGHGHSDQVGTYLAALGPEWVSHLVSIGGAIYTPLAGVGQCNVILSRHPLSDVGGKALDKGRSVAWASVQGKRIYNGHVDNVSAGVRNVQLCQQLVLHKTLPPTILAGDFNAQAGSTELAPFFRWYKDAWTEGRKAGVATAFNTTGNTRNSRIDFVFYRGLTLTAVAVPDTRINGVWPSDHHPVVAEFA